MRQHIFGDGVCGKRGIPLEGCAGRLSQIGAQGRKGRETERKPKGTAGMTRSRAELAYELAPDTAETDGTLNVTPGRTLPSCLRRLSARFARARALAAICGGFRLLALRQRNRNDLNLLTYGALNLE